MNCLLRRSQLPDLSSFDEQTPATISPAPSPLGSASAGNAAIAPVDVRREGSPHAQRDGTGLVPAPMGSLYELTKAANPRSVTASGQPIDPSSEDIISRGVISPAEGEYLFARYLKNHHPLLWGGVLFPYETLQDVRRASILLSTSILTVAALHTPGRPETLQKCYDAFVHLVSSSCLSRHHTIDDIRALCLGAFYLPNLSWRLSGQAVRMAAEANMHQSFRKLMDGDGGQHGRVRLWYALYVCDLHFSIAHGRPSAMCDDAAARGVESFIQSPLAEAGDIRLSAQVALFRILSEAYLEYGSDQDQALSERDLGRLRRFNIDIEQWRLLWEPRSLDSPGIGSYPSQGVVMYYHFARFQLNSLALRGVHWSSNCVPPLSAGRREAATAAISAAVNTLTHILGEHDLRRALNGVPLFTHAMVAFCATFLLKIAAMLGRSGNDLADELGLGFNLPGVLRLTQQSADMLSEVAEQVSEKHSTRLVVVGIREMIKRVTGSEDHEMGGHGGAEGAESGVPVSQADGPGVAVDYGGGLMGNGVQEMISNMDMNSLVDLLENDSSEAFLSHFSGMGYNTWPGSG